MIKAGTDCVERLQRVIDSIDEKDYDHLASMAIVSAKLCDNFQKKYNKLSGSLRVLCDRT